MEGKPCLAGGSCSLEDALGYHGHPAEQHAACMPYREPTAHAAVPHLQLCRQSSPPSPTHDAQRTTGRCSTPHAADGSLLRSGSGQGLQLIERTISMPVALHNSAFSNPSNGSHRHLMRTDVLLSHAQTATSWAFSHQGSLGGQADGRSSRQSDYSRDGRGSRQSDYGRPSEASHACSGRASSKRSSASHGAAHMEPHGAVGWASSGVATPVLAPVPLCVPKPADRRSPMEHAASNTSNAGNGGSNHNSASSTPAAGASSELFERLHVSLSQCASLHVHILCAVCSSVHACLLACLLACMPVPCVQAVQFERRYQYRAPYRMDRSCLDVDWCMQARKHASTTPSLTCMLSSRSRALRPCSCCVPGPRHTTMPRGAQVGLQAHQPAAPTPLPCAKPGTADLPRWSSASAAGAASV